MMLSLPIFKQITYISPTAFLGWLNCEYKTYLVRQSGLPFIPIESSYYAEIGTCFDAFVKECIMVKRGMKIPALQLKYMLKDIKHEEAKVQGREAALRYIKTPLFHQFLTANEIYLEQELCSNHTTRKADQIVPILGRIDAIVDGKIIEWKCRGWGSKASPYPGYSDRYDCCYSSGQILQKSRHAELKPVEEFSFDWATQVLWYNWLLRNIPREYEIHEIVKREDGITIVQHKGQIGEKFEDTINQLLFKMWERLTGQLYYSTVDKPIPSMDICRKWNVLCEVANHCEFFRDWSKNGFNTMSTTEETPLHEADPMQFINRFNQSS